jgi:hypothetical protein
VPASSGSGETLRVWEVAGCVVRRGASASWGKCEEFRTAQVSVKGSQSRSLSVKLVRWRGLLEPVGRDGCPDVSAFVFVAGGGIQIPAAVSERRAQAGSGVQRLRRGQLLCFFYGRYRRTSDRQGQTGPSASAARQRRVRQRNERAGSVSKPRKSGPAQGE